MEAYAQEAKEENMDVKGVKLREIGWDKYFEQMQTK